MATVLEADSDISSGSLPYPNQHSKSEDDGLDYNQVHGGTDSEYLTARIARDHPDILERMKQGEYSSVRAAAIEAGIVKPRQQFTVGPRTSPKTFASALIKKLDAEFLMELTAILNESLS